MEKSQQSSTWPEVVREQVEAEVIQSIFGLVQKQTQHLKQTTSARARKKKMSARFQHRERHLRMTVKENGQQETIDIDETENTKVKVTHHTDNVTVNHHLRWFMFLIILTVIVYVINLVFNGLAAGGVDGLFEQSTGDVSDKYPMEVIPDNWAFAIWSFIYVWLALWLIYALTTLCRRNKFGTYIYVTNITPASIYILFIITNLLIIGWLFAFDREEFIVAFVLIVLILATIILTLTISYLDLDKDYSRFVDSGMQKDIWLIRLLEQNGLAFLGGWILVATLINLALVMTFDGIVSQTWSSTVALLFLGLIAGIWYILDMSVFARYTRYTFSVYIPWIVALAGIMTRTYDLDLALRNSIITLTLLIFVSICLVFKLIFMFVNVKKN